MITLKNISKEYTETMKALKNVDLEIKEGEFLAIMGPSGSGKTTLINILGCLDKQTEGDYFLNGANLSKCSDKEKARLRNEKFGFVVQDFGLISGLSVYKNVRIPLLYSKKKIGNRREHIKNILERLGIADKIEENVNRLSGGQRQRVAIARAIINSPDIILADEPTGALDRETGREVMEIFSELNKQGKTVIIVTHDKTVADVCKRIVQVVDGRIVS